MCRTYGSGDKMYTRLCYRFGAMRGRRVPGDVTGGHGCAKMDRPRLKRESVVEGHRQRHECTICGNPAISRHATTCPPGTEGCHA